MLGEVSLLGRIGNDLECKQFGGEKPGMYLQISLAVRKYDRNNQNEKTVWYPVTAFERNAEIIAQYSRKGDLIYLDCDLRVSKQLETDTQKERKFLNLVVKKFEFVASSSKNSQQENKNGDLTNAKSVTKENELEEHHQDDEPVPFI